MQNSNLFRSITNSKELCDESIFQNILDYMKTAEPCLLVKVTENSRMMNVMLIFSDTSVRCN